MSTANVLLALVTLLKVILCDQIYNNLLCNSSLWLPTRIRNSQYPIEWQFNHTNHNCALIRTGNDWSGQYLNEPHADQFSDYVIDVDIQLQTSIPDDDNNAAAAIMFRCASWNNINAYHPSTYCIGGYVLYLPVNDTTIESMTLQKTNGTTAIHLAYHSNTVTIEKSMTFKIILIKDTISIYLNNVYTFQVVDSMYNKGSFVGFAASQKSFTFSNLRIITNRTTSTTIIPQISTIIPTTSPTVTPITNAESSYDMDFILTMAAIGAGVIALCCVITIVCIMVYYNKQMKKMLQEAAPNKWVDSTATSNTTQRQECYIDRDEIVPVIQPTAPSPKHDKEIVELVKPTLNGVDTQNESMYSMASSIASMEQKSMETKGLIPSEPLVISGDGPNMDNMEDIEEEDDGIAITDEGGY